MNDYGVLATLPPDPNSFAAWLYDAMARRSMSMKSVARIAGTNHSTVSRLGRRDRIIELPTAIRLARVFRPRTARIADVRLRLTDYGVALTAAEYECLRLKALGFTYREIATERATSEHVIRTHLGRVYVKLGVDNDRQAFIAIGWLNVPGALRAGADGRAVSVYRDLHSSLQTTPPAFAPSAP